MTAEYFGRFRGVEYFRISKRLYRFEVDGKVYTADTLGGCHAMIGRLLNGLEATDCRVCKFLRERTPINVYDYCEKTTLEIPPDETAKDCWMFQVDRRRTR